LEVKIAELEKSFNVVASLGQVIKAKLIYQARASGSTSNLYMFGVVEEMKVSAIATCA